VLAHVEDCTCRCLVQELNVRIVTVTADKQKYGVMLRAEPDHKVLGGRLKAAFKTVLSGIRNLTDDQLTAFQQTGQIDVCGHLLGVDDLRLIYTFDQTSDDTPNHYEACSDNSVCQQLCFVVLNVMSYVISVLYSVHILTVCA